MDTIPKIYSGTFYVNGSEGRIFVDDGGNRESLPVVFVHSFGGNTAHWNAQLEHLRPDRRAIAFDFRGHGQSDTPRNNNNYHIQDLSTDISSVVDSLDLRQFVLVGHSMGGSAAIDYAFRNPERVAGLLLVGTPGNSSSEQAKPIIASLESDKYDKVMDDYMKRLLANADPMVSKKVREGMKGMSREESINIIKAVFDFNPLPALSTYPGPKLIVSASAEEQPNALSRQLPEIPHQVISGTSHWIQMDNPTAFNKVLDEFLKTVDQTNPHK